MRRSRLITHEDRGHLCAERSSLLPAPRQSPPRAWSLTRRPLPTNFRITLGNPYAFLLLHLRASPHCRNSLGVSIPDVCLFHNQAPYEVLFEEGGSIRGLREREGVRLLGVYELFLSRSKARGIQKREQCVAVMQGRRLTIQGRAMAGARIGACCSRTPTS
jgi:hypothetical protein